MGYFTTGLALKENLDLSCLGKIFPNEAFNLYEVSPSTLYLLDGEYEDEPFTNGLGDVEEVLFPLPESLVSFRKACRKLKVNTPYITKSGLSVPYFISKETKLQVCDFQSDDDDQEVIVKFSSGNLDFIKFIADDLRVEYTASEINIYPLILEDEEDATSKEVLSSLSDIDGVVVHERIDEYNLQLHGFVEKELSRFCGSSIEILEEADWESYKKTKFQPKKKSVWKFWQ